MAGIVVGNPLHLSGELSPRAAKTQAFAAELGELTGLPIHLWDERLTTREAHQMLYEAGHARQEHRRVVDQVAATLILQSFLDEKTGLGQERDRKCRGRLSGNPGSLRLTASTADCPPGNLWPCPRIMRSLVLLSLAV